MPMYNLIEYSDNYSKRQNELDADPRAIQQINFTANLDRTGNTTIFFINEEAIETIEAIIFTGHRKSFVNINLLRLILII